MSLSGKLSDIEDLSARTPSPGEDYNSLLYDSFDNSYSHATHLNRVNAAKHHFKQELEESPENNYRHSMKLKGKTEKSNQELKTEMLLMNRKHSLKQESLVKQLREQETHYSDLLAEKDQLIKELTRKLKLYEENYTKPKQKPKSTKQQKILSPRLFGNKTESIQNISKMIVALEKEQAELKHSLRELECLPETGRETKRISELISRNEFRLTEARTIQEEVIRSSLTRKHS